MNRMIITLILLTIPALPVLAAPTNTSGPWGVDASGFKNLSTALSSPSTMGKTVVVSESMAINNTTTDRAIRIEKGGRIDVASGKKLTINGPFKAGMHQVFAGDGAVIFGAGAPPEIFPEWRGAKCDGVTDSTAAIQATINSISHAYASKGGGKIIFSAPQQSSQFYKITKTIDLTEIWNVSLESPSLHFGDRGNETGLFRWYGAPNKNMIMLGFSFAANLKNISVNGRNIPGVVGFAIGADNAGYPNTAVVNSTYENLLATYCDIGIRVGDQSGAGADFSGLVFINPSVYYNSSIGFKMASTNAIVSAIGLKAFENGAKPYGGKKGANVYLGAGQLVLTGYISQGAGANKPADADIYMENGGLQIYGAWSDTHGYFLYSAFASSAAASSTLNGVRHFEGSMNGRNTPNSIHWTGPNPLVLQGCELYNNVVVVSGQLTKVVDLGTRFINRTATFTGDMVTKYNGYIGVGTYNNANEARLAVGRPARTDVGSYTPLTLWSDSHRAGFVRTSNDTTITETLKDDTHSYEMLFNVYNYLGDYKSIKAGPVARLQIRPGESNDFVWSYSTDATSAGQKVTFSSVALKVSAGKLQISSNLLPVYANNAAAKAGGLVAGSFYRSGGDPDSINIVH